MVDWGGGSPTKNGGGEYYSPGNSANVNLFFFGMVSSRDPKSKGM